MTQVNKRIAIKVGSNVLTRKDGTLDVTRISSLSDQLAQLMRNGYEVILISSGAVAAGRSELNNIPKLDAVQQRQLYSAVGQAKLINRYYELFREHSIPVGQVLTTKESFGTRTHYLTQRSCIHTMLIQGVLPIINENDTISVSELMFTDNDELSGLVATMMNCQQLILLSNVDGIYSGDPESPETELLQKIDPAVDLSKYIQSGKSSFGRGGMLTKCQIAQKLADEGVEVIIANGTRSRILLDLINEPNETPCTRFPASLHPTSSIKKWIAHSDSFAKGILVINKPAVEKLTSSEAVSLLPVGCVAINGTFKKNDIVEIHDEEGLLIGVGKVQYDSEKATSVLGKRGARPLVHYNYLYME